MRFIRLVIAVILFFCALVSCRNKSIMFKTDREYLGDTLKDKIDAAEKSYKIHVNDYLQYSVYTNRGERLIDPNYELRKNTVLQQSSEIPKYLVQNDSTTSLPMIGKQKVAGLKLSQLDSLLTKKYSDFYNDVYVISKVINKRVFVLGTASVNMVGTGNAKVIPLENENMNLIEVLTLAGGLDNLSKAHNIRLIRGDLKNPTVMIIDLSTIEGMKKATLLVQPNDIIYIERFQKRVIQSIQESSGLISILSTSLFVVISIISLNRQK